MQTRLIGFLVIGSVLLASSTRGTLTGPDITKIHTSGEGADLWIETDDTNRDSPVDPKRLIPDIAYHPPVERPARRPDPATHRKAAPTDFRVPEKPATEEERDLQTSSEIALLMTEYQAEEAALLRDRAEWVQQIRDSAAAAPTEPMRQREAQLRARAAGLAGLRAAIERIRKGSNRGDESAEGVIAQFSVFGFESAEGVIAQFSVFGFGSDGRRGQ